MSLPISIKKVVGIALMLRVENGLNLSFEPKLASQYFKSLNPSWPERPVVRVFQTTGICTEELFKTDFAQKYDSDHAKAIQTVDLTVLINNEEKTLEAAFCTFFKSDKPAFLIYNSPIQFEL